MLVGIVILPLKDLRQSQARMSAQTYITTPQRVSINWDNEAYYYAQLIMQEYPDLEQAELQKHMQHEPERPKFSADQIDFALSKRE